MMHLHTNPDLHADPKHSRARPHVQYICTCLHVLLLLLVRLCWLSYTGGDIAHLCVIAVLPSAFLFGGRGNPFASVSTRSHAVLHRYITKLQIVQFTYSLIALMYMLYLMFGMGRSCAGIPALVYNAVFNITLLKGFADILLGSTRPSHTTNKTQKAE